MMADTLRAVMTAVMVFLFAVNAFHMLLLMLAVPELWSHWQLSEDDYFRTLLGTDALPPVSVVATTYDDGGAAVELARALLALEYPRHEVVLVNDGSGDDSMARLIDAFGLARVSPAFTVSIPTAPVRAYYRSASHPRLLVIDKEHGGIQDALNAGVNAARYPLAMAVGTHVTFETDALLRLVRPFLLDREVQAVAGTVRVSNGGALTGGRFVPTVSRGWWLGVETLGHLRVSVFERLGWNRIASNLMFPGSVAIFRREHFLAVSGFNCHTSAPSVELSIRMQHELENRGVKPLFLVIPDAIAWASVPSTVRQRGRLLTLRQRGIVAALRQHASLVMNPEYGAFGVIAFPYYWLGEVAAPAVELLGYLGLVAGVVSGALPGAFVAAYLAAVLGFGVCISVWTVVLEGLTFDRYARRGDLARLLLYAVAEPFGFRQLSAWFRVRAYFQSRPTPIAHGQQPLARPT